MNRFHGGPFAQRVRDATRAARTTASRCVWGQVAQIIYVATRLGIADLLAQGTQTPRELETKTQVEERTLRRVLGGLIALGLCSEVEPGRYQLSTVGQYLRSDHPQSLRARILFNVEVLSPVWSRMLETTRTGVSGALSAFGVPFYEYLQQHPEAGELFDLTMANAIHYRVAAALEAYDFSRFNTVVDVGGGNGALLLAILKRWTRLEGIVFDLPGVAERIRPTIAAMPEGTRCSVQSGNALERVTEGADCYVLSNVLVSMTDSEATTILRNCRRAMAGGGKVVIVEWIMPSGGDESDELKRWDTASMDLNMLAIDGARGWRVRTREEFENLIAAADLALTCVVPIASAISVIECGAHEGRTVQPYACA